MGLVGPLWNVSAKTNREALGWQPNQIYSTCQTTDLWGEGARYSDVETDSWVHVPDLFVADHNNYACSFARYILEMRHKLPPKA